MGSRVEHAGQVAVSWRARAHGRRQSAPETRATLLLTPPLAWFVLLYLAALVVLLITAFWQINPFTTNIEHVWTLSNLSTILTLSLIHI